MKRERKPEPVPSLRSAHPTIATIAAHMGLSRATVTHVLNGRAAEQRISPDTQRRVLKAAHDLGYRANAAARAVRAGRFGNIALIQSLVGQYLPKELLQGLTKAIAAKDIRLVLTQVPDVAIDNELYLPDTMRNLSVDGVLVNRHVGVPPPYLADIHRLGIPAIFLNVKQDFDCVHPDDRMGGRMACEFLLGLGHERIVFVDTEDPENRHYSKLDRSTGYGEAMASAGMAPHIYTIPKEWEISGEPDLDKRVEAVTALLSQENRPSAIVAYELAEGMAVARAAYVLGLRIPRDLSLILFHSGVDDRYFIPMHTICNEMAEVGASAVEMLLEKIENPQIALPAKAVPLKLLEGATCMPHCA